MVNDSDVPAEARDENMDLKGIATPEIDNVSNAKKYEENCMQIGGQDVITSYNA